MKRGLLSGLVALLAIGCGCQSPKQQTPLTPTQQTVAKRAAFRKAFAHNPETALQAGIESDDPAIRRRCAYELYVRHGKEALPQLKKLAGDPEVMVAEILLVCGSDIIKNDKDKSLLEELSLHCTDNKIKLAAKRKCSVTAKLNRNTVRLKDNKSFDHDIVKIMTIPLPLEGLKLCLDPDDIGIEKKWFEEKLDDSKWAPQHIGRWEHQGFPNYDGLAWYRIRFDMPEKPDCNAVELYFPSVDECAWVWLNGIYVGQHDIGPSGWDKPFWIDVTAEIRWGASNLLVVRVEDSMQAGGILKPITAEVLK